MNPPVMDVEQAQGWVMVATAVVTMMAAFGSMVVGIITALRQGRTEKKVDAQAVKQDEQAVKQDEQGAGIEKIGEATNGALSLAKEALQISRDRVTQLEESIRSEGSVVPSETKQTEQKPVPLPPEVLHERTSAIPIEPTPPTTPPPTSEPPKP